MIKELYYLLNILLAVVLGFAIGYERKLRYKEAGIRTHTIVCAGSALIMVVSKYGFADIMEYDASRVAAQIVSGIGFLGAGIIIIALGYNLGGPILIIALLSLVLNLVLTGAFVMIVKKLSLKVYGETASKECYI